MPAELFQFPPRRSSVDGDVPSDAVALLRSLAKQAAEAGADPSAVVIPDLELLLVCDSLLLLKRAADKAEEACERTPAPRSGGCEARAEMQRRRRACVAAMRRAGKLRAVTPVGIFAKAVAVRRVGRGAVELAVSLADDLLNDPGLRTVLWPTGER